MKLLVVVAVLVTSYEEIFRNSLKCGRDFFPNIPGDTSLYVEAETWLIWIPGGEQAKLEGPGDEVKRGDQLPVITRPPQEDPTQKYFYSDDLIPTTPGDNSHYVEGQSRYIWIPDGDGAPHLVDLQELDGNSLMERNVADTAYWLFTRRNPYIPQQIAIYQSDSIRHCNFMPSRPIVVIIHGWLSDSTDSFTALMKSTFLSVQDVNVIAVDWRNLAKTGYMTSVRAVPEVGRHIAVFLTWLIKASGASWTNVHLIGFSIGAHIAGCAGRSAGGKPGRVSGLDPAGPFFHGNPDNLSPFDAQYVEVIHTDGDRLGHFGRLGQVDFYVNGGRNPQPGCILSTCSHSRVKDLFAATVRFDHLVGHRCKNITEAEMVECRGAKMKMGNAILIKRENGIFGLRTGGSWPY